MSHDLTNLVYDTLFWSQVRDEPEPWLAERAEPSADRKQWTVTLRPGVTWHDGQPLTADDVAFTFEKMKSPTGGRYSHHVWEYPVFESAEVLDRLTVRINFRDAAPTFKILPGGDLPIVPKHIWEKIEDASKATDILPGRDRPVQDGVHRAGPDLPAGGQRRLLQGQAEGGCHRPSDRPRPVRRLRRSPDRPDRQRRPRRATRAVRPDVEPARDHGGAVDPDGVRPPALQQPQGGTGRRPCAHAVTESINLNAVVQTVLLGHARPGRDTWLHPDSAWADPQGGHVFDVTRANQGLDDAGYRRGEDGVRRTPDGNRLEFGLSVAANEPQHQRSAQLIAQQVEALGVRINVESIDAATLRQRRGTGNYDTFITNLESHAHADPDALYFFFHSPAPGAPAGSFGGYSNPHFDRLVEQARATIDNTDRKRLLVEAQRIYAADAPALVLYYPNGDYAYRTAAYNGWIADTGRGILTKRSFIPGYETTAQGAAVASGSTDDGPPWPAIGVVLGLIVVGGGVLVGLSTVRVGRIADGGLLRTRPRQV